MKTLLQLYFSFFKVGLMTFGGGLSMFPMLEREVIDRRKWCTKEEILDYYAVGQCTPGIIAVDVSAFIGYRLKKTLGAVIAPLGVISPGFGIMLLLATVLQQVADYPAVQSAFVGVRVAVCALITVSVVNILRESVRNLWQLAVALLAFVVVAVFGANPAWVVLGAALLGLAQGRLQKGKPAPEGSHRP
ncbi:MAG: chromate transporter [Oscillospiraceae bacterium]|jgi:chromate transporter|nr:chromate transporter [Oscillospiraceae bacterium]